MNNKPKVVKIYVFVDSKDTPTDEKILYSIREYLKNEPKEELGKAPSFNGEIVIKRSERGKPYVEGDLGIGISVSHSGSVFVCGVSKGEIGLDIELPKILGNESDEEMKKRLLIFDLDGTLADTMPALREGMNMALAHYGFAEKSREELLLHHPYRLQCGNLRRILN